MNKVSASEFDLLSVARCLVSGDGESVSWILQRSRDMPKAFSPQCHALLEDLLAKGVLLRLMRWGGWQDTRSLQGLEVKKGRLWERHESLSLRYSDASLQVLVALVGGSLSARVPKLKVAELSLGDELVMLFALDLVEEANCSNYFGQSPAVRKSPLCWLARPNLLAPHGVPEDLDFEPWVSGEGAVVLESLGPQLMRRWVAAEWGKALVVEHEGLALIGQAQKLVLQSFLASCEKACRPDLAFFLVRAAATLAKSGVGAQDLVAGLGKHRNMSERSLALAGAAAFIEGLAPLQRWVQENRALRFFDDEYEAGQLLLEEWNFLGDIGYASLQSVASELRSAKALED